MDYIYGKLNNKVKSVEYNGINSDTTNITVDNSDRENRTIKVDVIKTPGTLTINNTNGESVSFNGSIDENITIDSPTTEQYQELVTKVNDLENTQEEMNKVMPTDINVDSNGKLILEHDGVEITGQKKLVDFNSKLDKTGGEINGDLEITGELTTLTGITMLDESAITFKDTKETTDENYINTIWKDNTSNILQTSGPVKVNGLVTANGFFTEGSIYVDGDGTIEGDFYTQGETNLSTLGKNVSVGGDTTFSKNVTIVGDLKVSGTTTTVDTETLKVKDNVIVTNSDKNKLIDLSGLAINTDETNTFGIMYNPTSNTVDLGLGTITTEGKFTFNENEGLPLAIRDSNNSFTQDHLISWSTDKNKLTDSGIAKSKVKDLTDHISYDSDAQTTAKPKDAIHIDSKLVVDNYIRTTNSIVCGKYIQFGDKYSDTGNPTMLVRKTGEEFDFSADFLFVYGLKAYILSIPKGMSQPYNHYILTDNNIKTINNTSLYDTAKGNISIPVVQETTTVGDTELMHLQIDDTIYNIVDSNSSNYAKLDSENTFTKAQTFNDSISTKSILVKDSSSIEFYPSDYDETVPTRYMQLSGDIDHSTFYFYNADGALGMTLDVDNDGQIITTRNIASNTSNKLDKVTTVDTTKLYMKNADGTQGMITLSQSASGNSVVHRDANGKSQIATPTDSDTKYITNVEYVKNYVANNSSKLTVTDNEDGTLTLSF